MPDKKTDGGDGRGQTPTSRKKKTGTTTKSQRASSTKPSTPKGANRRKPSTAKQRVPTSEELHAIIAKRAYELYESRGWRPEGDLSDWLEAEQQILTEQSNGRL